MNITLESHLKAISEEEDNKLYSNWMVIKQELCSKLETVSNYFQHFSLHNATHSQEICNNIERFLGQDRIKKLSATDTWMLLMAFYSHDIGMALKYENIKEIFEEKKFKQELKELSEGKSPELREAAKRVMAFEEVHGCLDSIKGKRALDIFRDVQLIIEEHYRKGHAERSAKSIEEFFEDRFTTINSRMIDLLKKICIAHQENISNIEKLHYEENGMFQDYVHPRFVAAMLCLGDLLDMDTNRFSKYGVEAASTMAHESELHKQKHESLKHFLIKPDGIEIEMDSPSVEVHRVSRQWVDWIEDTIKYLTLNWSVIAPEDFGNPPKLKEKKLLIKGSELFNGFADLRFTIDQDKALEILQGAGIYKDKFVCIREVIQNAVDSCLIQLWKDLNISNKDEEIIKFWHDLNMKNYDEEFVTEQFKIFNNYDIEVSIYVNDEKQVVIEVSDKGTGISNKCLKAMSNIGSKKDKRTDKEIIESMPGWLRPSGQFGLGLQSIFLVADKFEMITKCDDEPSKKIIFESGQGNTGYISVEKGDKKSRGTTVKICIDEDKISKYDIDDGDDTVKIKDKCYLIEDFIVAKLKSNDIFTTRDNECKVVEENVMFIAKNCISDNVNYFNLYINHINNCEIITSSKEEIQFYNSIFLKKEFYEVSTCGECNNCFEGSFHNNLPFSDYRYMNFEYFDYELKTICNIHFVKFRNDSDNISYENNNYGMENKVFFKNVFVCDLDSENIFKNFSFEINIFDKKADKILSISRNSIKEEYKREFKSFLLNILKNTFNALKQGIIQSSVNIPKEYYCIIYQNLKFFNLIDKEFTDLCKKQNFRYIDMMNYSLTRMNRTNLFFTKTFEQILQSQFKSLIAINNNLDNLFEIMSKIKKENIIELSQDDVIESQQLEQLKNKGVLNELLDKKYLIESRFVNEFGINYVECSTKIVRINNDRYIAQCH